MEKSSPKFTVDAVRRDHTDTLSSREKHNNYDCHKKRSLKKNKVLELSARMARSVLGKQLYQPGS